MQWLTLWMYYCQNGLIPRNTTFSPAYILMMFIKPFSQSAWIGLVIHFGLMQVIQWKEITLGGNHLNFGSAFNGMV